MRATGYAPAPVALSPKTLLIALPAITVLFFAFALLMVGPGGRVPAARIYGGPTERAEILAWRVLVFERVGGVDHVIPNARLHVEVELPSGRVIGWGGTTAADGLADVELSVGRHEAREKLLATVIWQSPNGPRTLLQAPLNLSVSTWRRIQRVRGGASTQKHGDLTLSVSPRDGVLAVPFETELLLSVDQAGVAASGVSLHVSGEGVTFPKGATLRSDEQGRARVLVRPSFHQISLNIEADKPPHLKGHYNGVLPVVPGAISVSWRRQGSEQELTFRSPVPRDRVYFSVVSRELRLLGGSVALKTAPDGSAFGTVRRRIPDLAPVWVVTSGDFDLQSFATVGWPMYQAAGDPHLVPRATLDTPDFPLADGLPAALRLEEKRQRHAHFVAALAALLGLGVSAWLLVYVYRGSRSPAFDLAMQQLSGTPPGNVAPTFSAGALWAIVGVFLAALGFALLALFALFQR